MSGKYFVMPLQVRAMSALAELLTVSGSSTSAAAQGSGADQLGSSSSSSSRPTLSS